MRSDLFSPRAYAKHTTQQTLITPTITKEVELYGTKNLTNTEIMKLKKNTTAHFKITLLKYFRKEIFINGLIINKRTTNAIAQITRCTTNTEAGLPPIFKTTYETGRIINKIPPMTD